MSNYYTVDEFINLIDEELKQTENNHRTTINDSMRLAKQAEIINWLNQALGELLEYNKGFYFRVNTYTPSADTSTINIPFFMRRLDKVMYSGKWYNVSFYGDSDAKIWYEGGRTIVGNGIVFAGGTPLMFKGIHSPDRVTDLSSIIDFPPTFIRLLVLQVLLYFSARDNRKKELWFAQYQLLLRNYKGSSMNVAAHGKTESPVSFGDYNA